PVITTGPRAEIASRAHSAPWNARPQRKAARLEIALPPGVSDLHPLLRGADMKRTALLLWALTTAALAGSAQAQIKIVYIDPHSGLMAATGDHGLRELRFAADRINGRGGIL